jgi:hypothetical protein
VRSVPRFLNRYRRHRTNPYRPSTQALGRVTRFLPAPQLAELLQFVADWLAADPARLAPLFLAYVGHPAYGLDALRADLERFTFLLGGSDGEDLFSQR